MTLEEEVVALRQERDSLKRQLGDAARALSAQDLDVQRKEVVFEIYDRLISAQGEVIAIAAEAHQTGQLGALADRIKTYAEEDLVAFQADLAKVESILPVGGGSGSHNAST